MTPNFQQWLNNMLGVDDDGESYLQRDLRKGSKAIGL